MGWERVKVGLRVLGVSAPEKKLNKDQVGTRVGSGCYSRGLIQPTFDP